MRHLLTLLTTTALLTGCDSRLTGNEGNLVFSYEADDDVTNFNKPIAVGGMLDIDVREVGTNATVELVSASYDDTAVLDVSEMRTSALTAEGIGDGTALLSVEVTNAEGETMTDSVNMLASTPEVMVMAHTCTDSAEAAYLVDQSVVVWFDMEMENGQPVIGYGYYPFDFDTGAAALSADNSAQWFVRVDTLSVGDVVMSSQIDDASLGMSVVDAGSIDGIEQPIAGVLEDIDVGDVNPFFVRPMVGSAVVCQAETPRSYTSLTPDICDVRELEAAPDLADDEEQAEHGWFEIEGVAAGTCEYEVSFTDGAAGAGVTQSFTYTIEL